MIAIDDIGEGQPLVLLHGVGASRIVWRRVVPCLSADRRVLAADLPGFGDSQPAGPGFDLDTAARALAEALADRVAAPFDLLGNSLGGAVALKLAHLHPGLVRGLMLAAPAGFSSRPWPLALAAGALIDPAIKLRRILGAPLVASPTVRRALLWGAIAEPQRMPADDALTMLRASQGATRLGCALSTVLRTDLADDLGELSLPIGLIWGRRDRIVSISTLDRIRSLRPDVIVETIDDAAHVPQLERPTAFVAAVRRLLANFEQLRPVSSFV